MRHLPLRPARDFIHYAIAAACSLITGCGLASLTSSAVNKPDAGATSPAAAWSAASYFQALTDIPAAELAAAEDQVSTMSVMSYYSLLKSLVTATPVATEGHTFANPAAAVAAQASLYQALGVRFDSVSALWSGLGLTRTPPTAAGVQSDLERMIAADVGNPSRNGLDLVSYSVLSGMQNGIDCDSYLAQLEAVAGITRYAIARLLAGLATKLESKRQREKFAESNCFVGPNEVNFTVKAEKGGDGGPPILYGSLSLSSASQPSAILNNCFKMIPDYGPDEWAGWPDTQ